eukprot:14663133-Alexandrium_andersonii.AAC.1
MGLAQGCSLERPGPDSGGVALNAALSEVCHVAPEYLPATAAWECARALEFGGGTPSTPMSPS